MAKTVCAYCGHVGLRRDMIRSKHTGRAWCIDEDACRKRVDQAFKRSSKEEVSNAGAA